MLGDVPLDGLAVTLVDERYGVVGHPDSNWHKLIEAGFSLDNAKLLPVLRGEGFDETVASYGDLIALLLENADYRVALMGMGADGHIAGLLPGVSVRQDEALVVGYKADDYERLSITPTAIGRLDEVVLVTAGASKWPQLARLKTDIDSADQPAQLLKRVPKVQIYSDDKEL